MNHPGELDLDFVDLKVTYEDGTAETLSSDKDWKKQILEELFLIVFIQVNIITQAWKKRAGITSF